MKKESKMCMFCRTDADGYSRYLPKRFGSVGVYIHHSFVPNEYYLHGGTFKHPINTIINFCPMCGRNLKDDHDSGGRHGTGRNMDIKVVNADNKVPFSKVGIGSIFARGSTSKPYLKVPSVHTFSPMDPSKRDLIINAVKLWNGLRESDRLCRILDDELVIPLKAELVIHKYEVHEEG